MKKFLSLCIVSIFSVSFLFTGACFADEGVKVAAPEPAEKCESGSRWLQGIELLTGFSKGNLKDSKSYSTIPIIFDFDFDLNPLVKKIGINHWGLLQFQLEPSISPVFEPKANVEFGTGFILKIGILPQDSKFQPYVKGGPGLLYTTQHTREQGTQFNFFEYVGVGAHYFFTKNTALTVEGRYRHFSNCGIEDPNHGINSYFALVGLAYQY